MKNIISTKRPQFIAHVLFGGFLVLFSACDTDEVNDQAPLPEMEIEWLNYEVTPPTGAMLSMLTESPYLYPQQTCTLITPSDNLPPNATTTFDETGQEQVCVWDSVIGTVPEGYRFTERQGCERVWTQAPSWFRPPSRVYESDAKLLDDSEYATELKWVRGQVHSGGCSCCHASGSSSGYATGWDIDAPLVWTDSIANYQLAMLSGMFGENEEFGSIAPEQNHGFDRSHTMFATTDSDRMRTFFISELERRNVSNDDLEAGQAAMQNFFGRRNVEDKECITPFEGIVDGRVVWNGERGIRQLYVLEIDAKIPGFPPFNDRPDGIVWAIYVNPEEAAITSGEILLTELPTSARQMAPNDGAIPQLIEGRSYRLYATPDFMRRFTMNCTFTY